MVEDKKYECPGCRAEERYCFHKSSAHADTGTASGTADIDSGDARWECAKCGWNDKPSKFVAKQESHTYQW